MVMGLVPTKIYYRNHIVKSGLAVVHYSKANQVIYPV